MHRLDRDEAREAHRPPHASEIDGRHAARRELAEQLVPLAITGDRRAVCNRNGVPARSSVGFGGHHRVRQ